MAILIHQRDIHVIPRNSVHTTPPRTQPKQVDNFADVSFRRFQQLSSPSLHYPAFPVQPNCRHPPFTHTFARKRRSSREWRLQKTTRHKNCTVQTEEITISISFGMSAPLQRSCMCRRLKWSQRVARKCQPRSPVHPQLH